MFYDRYVELCEKAGKKPYTVAREIGLGTSNVAVWKKGSTPRPDVLQKLSAYFGVSQAVLLGLDQKEKPTASSDEQLDAELIMRLCQLTPDEIQKVDAFVQGILASR